MASQSASENKPASPRVGTLARKTSETDVTVTFNLDRRGDYDVDTGNGFLDHMVNQLARHGLFDITLHAKGDVHTGWHHLVEDVGKIGRASCRERV